MQITHRSEKKNGDNAECGLSHSLSFSRSTKQSDSPCRHLVQWLARLTATRVLCCRSQDGQSS